MEDIKETKIEIRNDIANTLRAMPAEKVLEKTRTIESRLFDFANFLEAKIALLYVGTESEVNSENIIRRAFEYNKIVVLPGFDPEKHEMKLMKVDDPDKDLNPGPRGVLEPNPARCKVVPITSIDIAIVPGIALDEKGGRVGTGQGYYDRFIPKLPITTRKVSLAFEEQIIPLVPMESHDKHVDIIITEKRIIYKI